jgi:hypothetical protein
MTRTEPNNVFWKTALIAALLVALVGLIIAATSAQAADTGSRLDRKVRVMERVLDEVLVQSPHVMVSRSGNARGLVLDEFGALFIIEGSLGVEELMLPAGPAWTIAAGEDALLLDRGRRPRERGEGEEDEESTWKEWREQAEEKRRQHLDGLKADLTDALIDYGATLGELDNDQWVAVVAFLGERFLIDHADRGTRMVLKIKMGDLRQYAAGSLSRDAAIAKVVVEN